MIRRPTTDTFKGPGRAGRGYYPVADQHDAWSQTGSQEGL